MNAAQVYSESVSAVLPPDILSQLEEPSELLPELSPGSRRGQQVARLRQLGIYKAADAVEVCGRLGEKATFDCGRQYLRKIIRSHRRFCCRWCDSHTADRLYRDHSAYEVRLNSSGTLHYILAKSNHFEVSPDGIRDFENVVAKSARRWLRLHSETFGLKFYTSVEDGLLVAKCIVYVPPGVELLANRLEIPNSIVIVGAKTSVHAYPNMLAEILKPTHCADGVQRAELMAAFQGGNHLRSAGVFYGLISQEREAVAGGEEDLCLSRERSGTGHTPLETCPTCGPTCKLKSISLALTHDLTALPSLKRGVETGLGGEWSYLKAAPNAACPPTWLKKG
jgi:hypothetical protein